MKMNSKIMLMILTRTNYLLRVLAQEAERQGPVREEYALQGGMIFDIHSLMNLFILFPFNKYLEPLHARQTEHSW